MNPIRIGRLAVLGLAVALAVPAVATSANEVTKWNDIAVSTVNAQPAITSAPSAGSIFVAMVQGAVYGAVNAVDRHGRPYLVNRSYPKASPEAAAATAAFRVLNTLFPSTGAAGPRTTPRSQESRTGRPSRRGSRSARWRPTRCSPRDTTGAC